jgi:hypothetical protein
MHWGEKYTFERPPVAGGKWRAVAQFGSHDKLEADSATELLSEVRKHYAEHREQP